MLSFTHLLATETHPISSALLWSPQELRVRSSWSVPRVVWEPLSKEDQCLNPTQMKGINLQMVIFHLIMIRVWFLFVCFIQIESRAVILYQIEQFLTGSMSWYQDCNKYYSLDRLCCAEVLNHPLFIYNVWPYCNILNWYRAECSGFVIQSSPHVWPWQHIVPFAPGVKGLCLSVRATKTPLLDLLSASKKQYLKVFKKQKKIQQSPGPPDQT